MTQERLANSVGFSLTPIKSLEKGRGKLETLILVLRELQVLDRMDDFLADPGISPIQLAKIYSRKKPRQQATNKARR